MVNFCAKKEEKLAYPKLVVFPCHYSFLDISKRSVRESSKSSNRFEAANSIKKKKNLQQKDWACGKFFCKKRRKKWQMQND